MDFQSFCSSEPEEPGFGLQITSIPQTMRYYALKRDFSNLKERKRVINNLVSLKEDMDEKVPAKAFNENVIVATWNIRDFDSNKFGHGPREKESIYYMAEILSSFDLIAVQEVNEDLGALQTLMYIMGPNWDYIMTDVTEGRSGNGERMVYIYDTNRVSFKKLAGEIVLSNRNLVNDALQFARTPYLVGFQSGWFKFNLCTVHIYYGAKSGPALERRINEIHELAKSMSKRVKRTRENLILLGDFNIVSPEHKTMEALKENGFKIPEAIQQSPSNMYKTMHYDQIAFQERSAEVMLGENPNSAGAYDFYRKVFTTRKFPEYQEVVKESLTRRIKEKEEERRKTSSTAKKAEIKKEIDGLKEILSTDANQKEYYKKTWRTFQMSDHLPMWTELKINFSLTYLDKIKNE